MKSNIEKVYSKLPQKKHNLGKHKVDLESAQDLKNSLEKAEASYRAFDIASWSNTYIELQNKVNEIVNLYDTWINDADSLENSMIGFEDKANQLGVNPMTIDGFQEAVFLFDEFEANFQDLKDTIEIMKSIPNLP